MGDAGAGVVTPLGSGEITAGKEARVALIIDGSGPGEANAVLAASRASGQACSTRTIEQKMGIDSNWS